MITASCRIMTASIPADYNHSLLERSRHTPASSADINPIERVWAELKQYIARRVKPLNKSELVKSIATFWPWRMAPAKCIKYIDHMQKVLPKVKAKKGSITGE